MDDSLFRETFMVQIIVFSQAIKDPITKEQMSLIKLNKEETDMATKVAKQATLLL